MDDRQIIEDLLSALEYHTEQTRPIEFSKVAIQAAREYLRNPPQRPWVGLTEQQIKILLSDSKCWIGDDCSMPNLNYIVRLVEKAHGIGE